MKKLLIFTSCFLSIILINPPLKACGGEFWSEDLSLFAPEFITTKYSNYYREIYSTIKFGEDDQINHFRSSNEDYWFKAFNGNLSKKDISAILYQYSIKEIDGLIFQLKGKSNQASILKNSITKLKEKRKAISFLYYIGFAKRCEYVNDSRNYSWWEDIQESSISKEEIEKLIKGGLKNAIANPFPRIKERYYLQLVRLHFALARRGRMISNTTNKSTNQFFLAHRALMDSGFNSYWRAQSYAAGALKRAKKYGLSNFYYAQLNQRPMFKNIAQLSYTLQEQKDFEQTLKLASSVKDKIALWKLQGIEFNSFLALQEIYKLNPKAEELNLFLGRVVNIIEEDLNYSLQKTDRLLDSSHTNYYLDRNHTLQEFNEIFTFIHEVANKNNTDKPYAWHAAAGYLASLQQQSQTADHHFERSVQKAPKNSLVQDQLRVLQLVHFLEKIELIQTHHKKWIEPELQWLFNRDKHSSRLRTHAVRAYVLKKLSYLHHQNEEPYLAQFTSTYFHKAFYLSQQHLDGLINKMKQANSWERALLKHFPFTVNEVKKTKGILFFYQEKIDSAIVYFSQVDFEAYEKMNDFVFETNTQDCIHCYDYYKEGYHKLEFLRRVKLIKDNIAKKHNLSYNYYQLANSYYNTSYFGNHRGFGGEILLGTPNLSFYYPNTWMGQAEMYPILQNDIALKYYKLAAEHSRDQEFKATCYFRAAKCEQNNWIRTHGDRAPNEGTTYYFDLLKEKYAKTQYYQEIIQECEYFRTYLKK